MKRVKTIFLFLLVVCSLFIPKFALSQQGDDGTSARHLKTVHSALNQETLFEELGFVFRSQGDASVDATDFCTTAPFEVQLAGGAKLFSISTRASDGQIQDFQKKAVADLEACFNFAGFPDEYAFYSRATLHKSGLAFTFDGVCRAILLNTPEAGARQVNCTQQAVEVPTGFVGGLLTTNTLSGTAGALGYNDGSIATLRIFQER